MSPQARDVVGEESVTGSFPVGIAPADVTLVCASCGGPMPPGRAGSERRYCSTTCRKRASRGGTPSRAVSEGPRGRDDAVHALCLTIIREDGLRLGMDALSRIFADETARLAALPEYTRRDVAGRIAAALGLSLKDAAA